MIRSKQVNVLWLVNLMVITIKMTHARHHCDEVDTQREAKE
jgi:hypothetical protein